jgi:hypothetical protein
LPPNVARNEQLLGVSHECAASVDEAEMRQPAQPHAVEEAAREIVNAHAHLAGQLVDVEYDASVVGRFDNARHWMNCGAANVEFGWIVDDKTRQAEFDITTP